MKNEFAVADKYNTKKEVAARLKVTTRTIDSWMHKGLVPFKKIGRTVRFDWEEVGARLAQSISCTSPAPRHQHPGTGIAASLRERAKEIRRQEH